MTSIPPNPAHLVLINCIINSAAGTYMTFYIFIFINTVNRNGRKSNHDVNYTGRRWRGCWGQGLTGFPSRTLQQILKNDYEQGRVNSVTGVHRQPKPISFVWSAGR